MIVHALVCRNDQDYFNRRKSEEKMRRSFSPNFNALMLQYL